MRLVSAARDAIVGGVMGVIGLVCGVLSLVALAIAAALPPIVGLVALILSPLRELVDRLMRPKSAA